MQDETVDLQPRLRQSAELVEKNSQAVENESRIVSEVKFAHKIGHCIV